MKIACIICKKEFDENEFELLPKFISNNGEPERAKRCPECLALFRKEKEERKHSKIYKKPSLKINKRTRFSVCNTCGEKFETTYLKNGNPHKTCQICRNKHCEDQKNSLISIKKKQADTVGLSLPLDDFEEKSNKKIDLSKDKEFKRMVAKEYALLLKEDCK